MNEPQHHGGQLRALAQRFGLDPANLLDFSANINPEGPPPAVLPALHAALADPTVLTHYPDLAHTDLKHSIATYAGVPPATVIVANGFVPILDAVLRTLPIRRCLLPLPAFVEYRSALTRAGIAITPHPLSQQDFAYHPDALLDTMEQGDHDAILLANPQNPTGVLHSAALLLSLVTRAAARNITVLLDEAFIDYAPEASLSHLVHQHPNLIVFRSVTKFHGFPGLRVAYALAAPSIAAQVEASLPPWPVTTLAARAVIAALPDHAYAHRTRALNNQHSQHLRTGLKKLGLPTWPSPANFLLFRLPPTVDPHLFWTTLLTRHGCVLRACFNYQHLDPHHLRVAVRTPAEHDPLLTAIEQSL